MKGASRQETGGGPYSIPDMEILKQQMHEAISAFLGGIPATSRFSMNFESDILDIRVHCELAPTENALRKRKKKVPPSKIKRNRQRLMKFLEKPAAQPDLPLITSCERSSEGGEIPSRSPLIPPLGTCTEVGLEFDTSADTDPHSYLQASSITCKESEHSIQGDEEKGKDEGKGQGQVDPPPLSDTDLDWLPGITKMLAEIRDKTKITKMETNQTNTEKSSDREDMEKDNGTRSDWETTDEDEWGTPHRNDWGRPCSPWTRKNSCHSNTPQPNTGPSTGNTENKTEIETESEPGPDAQPVRAVRVPAHQASDKKFVKVGRKRRKKKNHQTDCKTS